MYNVIYVEIYWIFCIVWNNNKNKINNNNNEK